MPYQNYALDTTEEVTLTYQLKFLFYLFQRRHPLLSARPTLPIPEVPMNPANSLEQPRNLSPDGMTSSLGTNGF